MESERIDQLIYRLLDINRETYEFDRKRVSISEVLEILEVGRQVFLNDKVLLDLQAPIKIVGDMHGQYIDLLHIFDTCGYPPAQAYLFLGDYVDRGPMGIEIVCLLTLLKIRYPTSIFMLRGNHETSRINGPYGFHNECCRKYDERVYTTANAMFDCLPVAALVDTKIFCVHGGLSPLLTSLQQIRSLARPMPELNDLVTDLLWSDPVREGRSTAAWVPGERGISGRYTPEMVRAFLHGEDIDLLVRAHEEIASPYIDHCFVDGRRCITVFSAPNYDGHGIKERQANSACVLDVSDQLDVTPILITPTNDPNFSDFRGEGTPAPPSDF